MDGRGAAFSLALALPLAFAIDRAWGEPRDRWHPVAWFGVVLRPIGRSLRRQTPALALAGGALVWLLACAAIVGAAWAVQRALLRQPAWLAVPALALLLKPGFAWRMLRDEVAAVEAALTRDGVEAARARLARLVSRDVEIGRAHV